MKILSVDFDDYVFVPAPTQHKAQKVTAVEGTTIQISPDGHGVLVTVEGLPVDKSTRFYGWNRIASMAVQAAPAKRGAA